MPAPAARPYDGLVNTLTMLVAAPVVNAHAPGSCSTGLGAEGNAWPQHTDARARMRIATVNFILESFRTGYRRTSSCVCELAFTGTRCDRNEENVEVRNLFVEDRYRDVQMFARESQCSFHSDEGETIKPPLSRFLRCQRCHLCPHPFVLRGLLKSCGHDPTAESKRMLGAHIFTQHLRARFFDRRYN